MNPKESNDIDDDTRKNVYLLRLSLFHESVEPYAYASNGCLTVRLRAGRDLAKCVSVVHWDKFLPKKTTQVTVADFYALDGSNHVIFQASLSQPSKRFRYYFSLLQGNEEYYFSREGLSTTLPHPDRCFEVPYLGESDLFSPPRWAAGSVCYEVFPDRFFRGHYLSPRKKLAPWGTKPQRNSYFGGNLRGIMDKLDYISSLGVDVLYLTPIFRAKSNHKYDTTDYYAIDPDFGTEEDLRQLVTACHAQGIRLILDAVFNHMGDQHAIFRDIVAHGTESPYADWIYPITWPVDPSRRTYETFAYTPKMPKWRTANTEVEQYLIHVAEYWMERTGVDGWRLDVADEVEHAFWRHFRERIKGRYPEALICGEVWQFAMPWLRGEQFDTVMNYPFTSAVHDWLCKNLIDAQEFDQRIEQIRTQYPEDRLPYLWNLLGSHDTIRIMSACESNIQQVSLALFFQFTCFGSPMVYYGDDIGLTGGGDPECRGTMMWDPQEQNVQLLAQYRTLSALRKKYAVIRSGAYRPILRDISTQLYSYVRIPEAHRDASEQPLLCMINNGADPLALTLSDETLPDGTYQCIYGDILQRAVCTGQSLTLPAKSGNLFIRTGDKYAN
ncbi:MAG: alpha-glycosidase [Sulfobacillus benefaciens]|uniref:Alpha-glycosidase n=1 Tax=Sulfobacillus benefaciens TaxID=453960 RepID=A0A2T2XK73_9FIRM|nr:MAG: alpha-glycosidase [Sulfobacillus benefaciens]